MRSYGKLLLILSFSLFLASCGKDNDKKKKSAHPNGNVSGVNMFSLVTEQSVSARSIYGLWESETREDYYTDFEITFRVKFTEAQMEVAGECVFPSGKVLYSYVAVPATVTQRRIIVSSGITDTQVRGADTCIVSVEPFTLKIDNTGPKRSVKFEKVTPFGRLSKISNL